jgi:hypothetical protein
MAYMRPLCALILLQTVLCLPAAAQGMLPRWEVEAMAKSLEEYVAALQQLLEQVKPKEWVQKGASAAYDEQDAMLRSELANVSLSAQNLGRNPEKISVVVDTFLWLDRSGSMLQSITEGVDRYQNAALASLLRSAAARGQGAQEKLKEYMRQLAVEREAQLEIAHSEAQRCREQLVKRRPVRN